MGIERERGVCSTYRPRNVKGSTYNREGREGDSRMKTVEKPQREEKGTENTVKNKQEMEFFDINLTKDSSLLLHATYSPFYMRFLKKTILFSRFKNRCNKSAKQENLSLS